MKTKNNRLINVFVISLLVITTALSAGFYFSRPQSTASAENVPPQVMPSDKAVEIVAQQNSNPAPLSKTQNDVTVEITSTRIIDTGLEVGICYTTPDGGEWYPMPGHLFYAASEVYPDEYEFTDEIPADGNNTGMRCALVRYRIEDPNTISTPVEFSIIKIYATPREMYTPCQELLQRLETNPKAKAYGLKVRCAEAGDGNLAVTLLDHAQSVARDKANKELEQIVKAEVGGPWVFTIDEIER